MWRLADGPALLTAEAPGPMLLVVDCPNCGHDNRSLAKFCEECGAPLARACPKCKEETRPGAQFCDSCGQLLQPAAALAQPDPRSYTPAHLAEKMRRQRPSEGERRTVTVLFVDTVGSTPLAEKLGEEEMYSLMRECLSLMSEAIHRYEGHVATFTGDGMMPLRRSHRP